MTDIQIIGQQQGYFKLPHCLVSNLGDRHQMNNFPGNDYSVQTPELSKDHILLNLHKLFKYCVKILGLLLNILGFIFLM